jgi:hypothetical protein
VREFVVFDDIEFPSQAPVVREARCASVPVEGGQLLIVGREFCLVGAVEMLLRDDVGSESYLISNGRDEWERLVTPVHANADR